MSPQLVKPKTTALQWDHISASQPCQPLHCPPIPFPSSAGSPLRIAIIGLSGIGSRFALQLSSKEKTPHHHDLTSQSAMSNYPPPKGLTPHPEKKPPWFPSNNLV
ncbi:BQ2448_1091 [Microbotryum intermedium]|uniref:BQ2448_1091 protein n=1 Tax=Microbotryum intermedium TaxID=269621 RepID=A0A238F976_9BASI|nr:BQ2448_1091 [Microbotryum intermedium]